jgi:hypothetical protein
MDILQALYENDIKKPLFYPRKLSIDGDDKKVLICGPSKSGKTALIYDYLSSKKRGSFLYIDFYDDRIDQSLFIGLSTFLQKNSIEILVLENFDFSFTIPKVKEVIITSQIDREVEGFKKFTLYPLDFEEFISFKRSDMDIESIFNEYALHGSFPSLANVSKDNLVKLFQDLIKLLTKNEQEWRVFRLIALSQSKSVSLYSLFNEFKLFNKISKDRFYAVSKELQDRNLLFFIRKFNSPKADKKVYLIDFAIKSVLTFEKDFIKRFENMIFLELLKRGKEVYFTDLIDIYIPSSDVAVLPLAFMPKEMIKQKLKRVEKELLKYSIKRVEVITLEEEGEFMLGEIEVEIVPFWNWALRD